MDNSEYFKQLISLGVSEGEIEDGIAQGFTLKQLVELTLDNQEPEPASWERNHMQSKYGDQ